MSRNNLKTLKQENESLKAQLTCIALKGELEKLQETLKQQYYFDLLVYSTPLLLLVFLYIVYLLVLLCPSRLAFAGFRYPQSREIL